MMLHVLCILRSVEVGGAVWADSVRTNLLDKVFILHTLQQIGELSFGAHEFCIDAVHQPYGRHLVQGNGLHQTEPLSYLCVVRGHIISDEKLLENG